MLTLFACNISVDDTWQQALLKYQPCFNIPVSVLSEPLAIETFTENFAKFQRMVISGCEHCNITPIMHKVSLDRRRFALRLRNSRVRSSSASDTRYCNGCAVDIDDDILEHIPRSIHLAEQSLLQIPKDQGDCGSCAFFAATAATESAGLLGALHGVFPERELWRRLIMDDSQQFDLSELFLASTTWGINAFCDGGDAKEALNQLVAIGTVETEVDFPYDEWRQAWRIYPSTVSPKVSQEDYYLPFKLFNSKKGLKTPVVELHQSLGYMNRFKSESIARVKSYLARGIPVIGSMHAGDSMLFYSGTSVLHEDCTSLDIDHQIVFAGYGTFKGEEVYVIRNSWGKQYGAGGYFYVPIGRDSFCIEREAFAIIPGGLDFSELAALNGTAQTRGSANQMDADDGIFVVNTWEPDSFWYLYLVSAVSLLLVVAVIGLSIWGCVKCARRGRCCERKRYTPVAGKRQEETGAMEHMENIIT